MIAASAESGVAFADVIGQLIVPTPIVAPQPGIVMVPSGSEVVVRLLLAGGTTRDVTIECYGISPGYDPPCMEAPRVPTRSRSDPHNGYRDTPADATPLPTRAPDAIEAARPLQINEVSVTASVGRHEVKLGDATLANGFVEAVDFELADPWPDGIQFAGDGIHLELRSAEPDGQPFDNVYQHGWRQGVEHVSAILVYEVLHATPDASFQIRDVVVR